ncbi:hypothetical protein JL722_7577 [Aureococcus anophagefferens]|nr:hypothetical protein JL722_7577 [Aureococcus anophagefferens]
MFGFGGSSNDRIAITFDNEDARPKKKLSNNAVAHPVFANIEPVTGAPRARRAAKKRRRDAFAAGVVEIRVPQGKRLEHQGIKIEVIGQARRPRLLLIDAVAQPAPEVNNTIKMEVGIEECLHIEFEYDKTKYHLNDIIIGKVYFLLVRIKIKHMELAIIRREAAGSGPQMYNDSETITKFEVMDGAPVRGECIPIRLFLSNFVRARRVRLVFCFFCHGLIIAQNLTPTYRNINNKFNVRYYLNLVLVDQEERRYFKQQEITLYRAAE